MYIRFCIKVLLIRMKENKPICLSSNKLCKMVADHTFSIQKYREDSEDNEQTLVKSVSSTSFTRLSHAITLNGKTDTLKHYVDGLHDPSVVVHVKQDQGLPL